MPDDESISAVQTVRRQRVIIFVILGALVLSLGGLGASLFVKSPQQRAAEQKAPDPTTLTAPVAHKVLVSTAVVRGHVAPVSALPVAPVAAEGTSIVTAIPVKTGDKITAGGILAYVSGRPVFALPGAIPSYRDLRPGEKGDDITQLQKALVGLGFMSGDDITGYFGPATATGIREWYSARKTEPLTTSDLDPNETDNITAAEKEANAAKRAVTSAYNAKPRDSNAIREAEQNNKMATDKLARLVSRSGPILPRNELVFLPTMPATIGTISAKVGDDLAKAQTPLLTVQTGGLVVRSTVPSGSEKGIVAKQKVLITDDINRRDAEATVTSLGEYRAPGATSAEKKATEAGQVPEDNPSESTAGYPLVVTPNKPLEASWSGADVRLTITLGATKDKVLVVPTAAVTTRVDQQTIVTVASGDTRREVPVTVGVTTAGEVEVTPADAGALKPGDPVVVG